MKTPLLRKVFISTVVFVMLAGGAVLVLRYVYGINALHYLESSSPGMALDSFNGVKVYANGANFTESHGTHYSDDGYYYGKKWQCVEYVKRYYKDYLNHRMPEVYGHAKDFWDVSAGHGALNKSRNLYQFFNDSNCCPKVNDLVVFPYSSYGHVAIVSKVTGNKVEVVQQNIYGKPRETYDLVHNGRHWCMQQGTRKPVGWLRKIDN